MAKNVHEAICNVMKEVGYVQKETSPRLSYSYAGEAALITALRPAMITNQLVCYPVKQEGDYQDFKTKGGTPMHRCTGIVIFRFVHAPSDTSAEVQLRGECMDAGDKASGKALTVALKYALRQTFLIETGDDPDAPGGNGHSAGASTSGNAISGSKKAGSTNGKDVKRVKNQWEENILSIIVKDLALVQNRYHAVGILNKSPFMSVPYGKLKGPDAVGFVLGYLRVSTDDTVPEDKRGEAARALWAKEDARNELLLLANDCLAGEEA